MEVGKERLNLVLRSRPDLEKNKTSKAEGPDEGSNDFRIVVQRSG